MLCDIIHKVCEKSTCITESKVNSRKIQICGAITNVQLHEIGIKCGLRYGQSVIGPEMGMYTTVTIRQNKTSV